MTRIIIPTYNEARNLANLFWDVRRSLTSEPFHLFIVNDGSTDDTAHVLTDLGRAFDVTVRTHPVNRGVAAAFRTGFQATLEDAGDDDVIVLMEGDGTSPATLLPEMIRHVRAGADLVIASRFRKLGGYRRFPLKRLILSRGANLMFRLLFPIPGVTDYTIFYRAYQVPPLRATVDEHGNNFITSETFFANIEILLKLRKNLRRVEEVPLLYDYGRKHGKSGMNVWKNLRSYLAFIARSIARQKS